MPWGGVLGEMRVQIVGARLALEVAIKIAKSFAGKPRSYRLWGRSTIYIIPGVRV
jgi:hypothetical protein